MIFTEVLLFYKRFHRALLHNIDRTDTVFLVIRLSSVLLVSLKGINRIGDTHWLDRNAIFTSIINGSNDSSIGRGLDDNIIAQLNKQHGIKRHCAIHLFHGE